MKNYNYGTVLNSNRIEAIKTTEKGEKLIAFCRVFNYPKCKPQAELSHSLIIKLEAITDKI